MDVSARWTFRHEDFSALDISALVFLGHILVGDFFFDVDISELDGIFGKFVWNFGSSTILTVTNFNKPTLLGRNSPLSLDDGNWPSERLAVKLGISSNALWVRFCTLQQLAVSKGKNCLFDPSGSGVDLFISIIQISNQDGFYDARKIWGTQSSAEIENTE